MKLERRKNMKKVVICLAVTFLIGSVSIVGAEFQSQYDNTQGYDNSQIYDNTQGYENNQGYDNTTDYRKEFIKGVERQQMVQKTDDLGRTIQAVVPVGKPDAKIDEDTRIIKKGK